MSLGKQLRHAWNAFVADDEQKKAAAAGNYSPYRGRAAWGQNPSRNRMRHTNDKTILTAIYTRLAVDCAMSDMKHVRLDDQGRYVGDVDSYLNECLTVEANIDQSALAFFIDVYMSLFDNGDIAICPIDTTFNPEVTGGWDVKTMRVGEVINYYPQHVRVSVYNQVKGLREDLVLDKGVAAVVQNPFYSVMNEGSSVLQRLIRKLSILDTVDEASSSGKLDVLIQLPYTLKGESKKTQAANRARDLEVQLKGSQLGIGYIDATEKVVQLNRPAENNLQAQIEYLVNLLYSQLGLTPEIMNGSADEATMLNYMHRTIGPLTKAVEQGMIRTFLTKTARSQGQTIMDFPDPFKFLPLSQIADIADKLSRNEILSPNEIRGKLGFRPDKDPKSDALNNSNMPGGPTAPPDPNAPSNADLAPGTQDDLFEQMNSIIDDAFAGLPGSSNAAA